ncbi:MAG: thioesterase family protein [Tetrasphaera sp.]
MSHTPHSVDVALRWSDMDAYGHVNNVQYLRLLEDARIVAVADWLGEGDRLLKAGLIVSRHEIEYLAALTFRHAPVRVDIWPTRVTAASFDLAYEVRDPAEVGEQLYARAESTLVAYDLEAARPRRLSAHERARLQDLAGEPVAFRWRPR